LLVATLAAFSAAADAKPRRAKPKPKPLPALTVNAAQGIAFAHVFNNPPGGPLDETNWVVDGCTLATATRAECTYSGLRAVGAQPPIECHWSGGDTVGHWTCYRPPQPTEKCSGVLTVKVNRAHRNGYVAAVTQPTCVQTFEMRCALTDEQLLSLTSEERVAVLTYVDPETAAAVCERFGLPVLP